MNVQRIYDFLKKIEFRNQCLIEEACQRRRDERTARKKWETEKYDKISGLNHRYMSELEEVETLRKDEMECIEKHFDQVITEGEKYLTSIHEIEDDLVWLSEYFEFIKQEYALENEEIYVPYDKFDLPEEYCNMLKNIAEEYKTFAQKRTIFSNYIKNRRLGPVDKKRCIKLLNLSKKAENYYEEYYTLIKQQADCAKKDCDEKYDKQIVTINACQKKELQNLNTEYDAYPVVPIEEVDPSELYYVLKDNISFLAMDGKENIHRDDLNLHEWKRHFTIGYLDLETLNIDGDYLKKIIEQEKEMKYVSLEFSLTDQCLWVYKCNGRNQYQLHELMKQIILGFIQVCPLGHFEVKIVEGKMPDNEWKRDPYNRKLERMASAKHYRQYKGKGELRHQGVDEIYRLYNEMKRRETLFQEKGCENIFEYLDENPNGSVDVQLIVVYSSSLEDFSENTKKNFNELMSKGCHYGFYTMLICERNVDKAINRNHSLLEVICDGSKLFIGDLNMYYRIARIQSDEDMNSYFRKYLSMCFKISKNKELSMDYNTSILDGIITNKYLDKAGNNLEEDIDYNLSKNFISNF